MSEHGAARWRYNQIVLQDFYRLCGWYLDNASSTRERDYWRNLKAEIAGHCAAAQRNAIVTELRSE